MIVVGAGPAGATLAYELAKKGIGVLLLEKESLPRYKCCAGGVTARAVKLLDFDISEVVEDVVHNVSVTYNFGSPYVGHHTQPLIYTVMRDVFDHLLVKRAQQFGAVVIDGQEVRQIQTNADWIEISTAEGIFRSRLVAGADGAYSVVARKLGMKRNTEYIAAIEAEVVVPEEELAKRQSRVEMDLGCVPAGYAWVFPKRDHLSIGAGCPVSGAKNLKRYHQKFVNSLGIAHCHINRSGAHLTPIAMGKGVISQGRALLVGDAAGLVDPLTGEGIHNAIQSAQLAAAVIESALAQNNIDLRDYQQAVEQKILPEIAIARVLVGIFARFPYLVFKMLQSNESIWGASCRLLRGETSYSAIKEGLGGLKGVFGFLSRVRRS